ncbi:hypothetical protein [Nocardia sp. R7R-8]|uniref:hypothetical protein n=1 Tax=Nocardia sp. R7R-8 TaxID=3459304 RepID=UPI00403E1505
MRAVSTMRVAARPVRPSRCASSSGTEAASPTSQEAKRISFDLDGAQLEIDTWPQIPPYLEIEAATKHEVIRIAELLGYTEADLTGENTIKIYARHGIDLHTVRELRF